MTASGARAPPRPTTLARDLERVLSEVAGSVDDVIARPHPSPESLHDLHREMRRLRHAIGIWQQLLPTRHRELIGPLDRRLKRLARLVGRVRDRDVMLGLIEGSTLPRPSREEAEMLGRLRVRLRDDARTGRELLRVFLHSERDAHLFEGLRESLELPPRRTPKELLARILEEEQSVRHAGVRAAHRKARRRPSSARLHRLRIEVRRLRHLTEVRAHLSRGRPREFPPAVRRLQTRLGRLHDLDVVLGGLDNELRSSEWAAELRRERRRIRAAIQRSIRAHPWPKPEPPLASRGRPRNPRAGS
jgi:CHAD domain-containing protein